MLNNKIFVYKNYRMINIKKKFLFALALGFAIPFASVAQTDSTDMQTDTLSPMVISAKKTPEDWHLLDRKETGHYGISLEKAYDFLKGRKSKTVVVAVIDSGIDTLHEDLKPILWTNPGEIPGNGIDDDNNGFVDDIHGWNFLGGKDGRNVNEDSYEAARVYWKLKNKFGEEVPDTTDASLTGEARREAVMFVKARQAVVGDVNPAETVMMSRLLPVLEKGDSIIAADLGKEEFDGKDLKEYTPTAPEAKTAYSIYRNMQVGNKNDDITNKQILGFMKGEIRKAEAADRPPKDFRGEIVGDDYDDINDRFYGNVDVMAGTPSHGTHVSGIIAAVRNNGLGMNGIADNVRIMALRAVPDGDEHDKDIANAIRYAVDNGAQIISMSFGKSFSPQKEWVDDAIKYAASKDVLLVHAAGNDAKDVDVSDNFPTHTFLNGEVAKNYITVGASGDETNGGLTASFSNYGKEGVDVFAPGVDIYSTLPGGDKYGAMSGTSMAAPVVSGVAALVLEYFPDLSAEQLKYVIEKSAVPEADSVNLPGGMNEKVMLSDISKTGGVVNAYEAVKLASTLKGERAGEPSKKKKKR